MAKFKVGDRVRLVSNIHNQGKVVLNMCGLPIGAEGVIVRADDYLGLWDWIVDYPRHPGKVINGLASTEYFSDSSMLAPLTDPNAEWAAEKVRQLIKMPVAA